MRLLSLNPSIGYLSHPGTHSAHSDIPCKIRAISAISTSLSRLSRAHHGNFALLDLDFFDSQTTTQPSALPGRRTSPPKSVQPSHGSCPFARGEKLSLFLRFPLPSSTSTLLPRIFLDLYLAPQLHSFAILHSLK